MIEQSEKTTASTIKDIRRQLDTFRYIDYLRNLHAVAPLVRDGRSLRVAILRSCTIEPIEPILGLRLMLEGFNPAFWIGGYDQYVQEIVDTQSGLYRFRPDLVLLFVRVEELLPDFLDTFPNHPPSHWIERINARATELGNLVQRLEETIPAQVIVQNLTLPNGVHSGVYDPQIPDGQTYLVQQFNQRLARELTALRGAFVWDFDRFARAEGYDNLYDAKGWYVSRSPWIQSAYPGIVDDLMRYVRSALGLVKKCVVVDLDNTLWGGVAGEDGLEGVALGHTYPGNCYRDLQKELLKLYERGILLAINSKNNPDDAFAIIDKHPDMVLRRNHFAAFRINWANKAGNLREIAKELNIGVDSLVFIDDNPAECALVASECPECEIVELPAKPYLLPAAVRAIPGIENIRLTDEDRRKGEMYNAQAARSELEGSYTNIDEFLRTLNIEVRIEPAIPFSMPRIAQLTQKTNQFNMTTRRYTEPQVQAFAADPSWEVYSVASRDRFGDDGIIGVFMLRFARGTSTIDSFLLSCRVIGRGIEQAMLAFMAQLSKRRGAATLTGEFLRTAKNHPAAGLYEKMGFAQTGPTTFDLDLADIPFGFPEHLRIISARPPGGEEIAGAKGPLQASGQ